MFILIYASNTTFANERTRKSRRRDCAFENTDDHPCVLGKLRKKNRKGCIIAQLNIDSITNKFDSLKVLVAKNVDILVVSEAKDDSIFPPGQFLIDGVKHPLRYHLTRNERGILVYEREGSPLIKLNLEFSASIECIITEINLHKKRWAMLSIFRPHLKTKTILRRTR